MELCALGDMPPLGEAPEKMHAFLVRQDRFGEPITVAGLPAYRVPGFVGSYVRFVRDDSDIILCSHPADVQPAEAK